MDKNLARTIIRFTQLADPKHVIEFFNGNFDPNKSMSENVTDFLIDMHKAGRMDEIDIYLDVHEHASRINFKRLVFKIDIDGVLRDMLSVMVDLYNKEFGTTMKVSDVTDYSLKKSFPLFEENGMDVYDYFLNVHATDTMLAPMFEDANKIIEQIRAKGHKIVIVTYQPSIKANVLTLEWLEINKIQYDDICFVNGPDKTGIPCDIIIDDCPDFLEAEKDAKKICVDQPYNRNKEYDLRLAYFKDFACYL